jgi:hypothetical protein
MVAAFTAVGAVLILSLPQGYGQDKKEAKKEGEDNRKVSKVAQTVEQVGAAYKMVDFGREHKVPEALITAARVIATANSHKAEVDPKSKVNKPKQYNELKEAIGLLDEAIKMSNNSEPIKTLAAEARKEITRKPVGAVGGPTVTAGLFTGLDVDRRDSYFVVLYGGEITNISVRGFKASAPGLDLGLEVYDASGRLIAKDNSVGPNPFVSINVFQRGTFRIDVINYTPRIACDYVLRTN